MTIHKKRRLLREVRGLLEEVVDEFGDEFSSEVIERSVVGRAAALLGDPIIPFSKIGPHQPPKKSPLSVTYRPI